MQQEIHPHNFISKHDKKNQQFNMKMMKGARFSYEDAHLGLPA